MTGLLVCQNLTSAASHSSKLSFGWEEGGLQFVQHLYMLSINGDKKINFSLKGKQIKSDLCDTRLTKYTCHWIVQLHKPLRLWWLWSSFESQVNTTLNFKTQLQIKKKNKLCFYWNTHLVSSSVSWAHPAPSNATSPLLASIPSLPVSSGYYWPIPWGYVIRSPWAHCILMLALLWNRRRTPSEKRYVVSKV